MTNNIKSILAVAALSISATASAQNLESGYFTDGYLYRHDMNPAIGNERDYVAFPVLGNINVNVHGNVGIKNFLYNVNGRTTTFMNPSVSADEFLGKIKDRNKIGETFKMQILGAGFKSWGGYNTIELNVAERADVHLPGDALRLVKEGITTKEYNIGNIGAQAESYVELALGHSRDIDEQWRVGGKLKFLFGAGRANAKFDNTKLVLGADGKYNAIVEGEVEANVKGFQYLLDDDGKVKDVKVKGAGLGGFGMAIDLGAEFKLNDDWKFSAALLDLGFISWNTSAKALASGNQSIDMNEFSYNRDTEKYANKDGRELKDAFDDFNKVYKLTPEEGSKGATKMLGATLNIGAEYSLPAYRQLTFGALSTTRIMGKYTWTDFRISANVAPCKIFSAGANVAVGTYGWSFGWIANLHCTGFNLFLGMDHTLGKLAKQGAPLSSNAEFNMGINFPF